MQSKNIYNYNDYTPDVSSLDSLPTAEELGQQEIAAGRRAEPRRVRAARKTTRGKAAPKLQQPVKTEGTPFMKKLVEAFTGTSAKMLFGIFLCCLAVYLLVSFVSYFTACVKDQSLINSMPIGTVKQISNAGGEGGARLSEFLINESFGVGSLVIIAWLFCISLKLLIGKPRFKTVDFTIKCLIVLVTASLIIGLLTISAHTPVNWGGYHGRYVNEFVVNFVGWTGAVLLSIFMLSVFVVICLRDVVKWIMKKRHAYLERRRKAAEERAERKAREEEIRRMQQQEVIDDIKAGETTVLKTDDLATVMDHDTQVDFAGNEMPIYSVDSTATACDSEVSVPQETNDRSVADDNADNVSEEDIREPEPADSTATDEIQPAQDTIESDKMVVNVNAIGQTDKPKLRSQIDSFKDLNYKFPPFDLLNPGSERVSIDADEQMENKAKIEKTLLNFGIPIKKIEATVGPTVTLYEIVPDQGVKIARIRSLVDDIALSLAARGVRIIAPIPGKGTVGIEVANKDPQTVSMQTILKSKKYHDSKYHLPVALGSTISNEVYIADLAKMPHLLVAGATGQGKSVGLNAIIASLLYSKAPWELKFVLIDPKQVEFSLYNKLKNHYMAVIPGEEDNEPVITEMDRVEATLNSLCIEMEDRYSLLKAAHTRNIEEYNAKIGACLLNPEEGHRYLPYIVVVVDEFGDLVMIKGKSVEMPIARLAQKARAVGMHVIIATQRPSVNVITGIIKANFPARVSFKVTAVADSKTILDATGAQQLIGRGDMLIFNNSEMVRVQCAFIDTPEVENICDYIERQPGAQGPYELPEPAMPNGEESKGIGEVSMKDRDPLFDEVARLVVSKNQASTSSIQRIYSLGYTRAGRIMDQLESAGIVGPTQGGKPRSVLVDPAELEHILASI